MVEESEQSPDTFWWRLTKLEPTAFRGLVLMGAALAASVGIHFAPGIPEALIGFVVVLMPVVQFLWTRGAVTPNAKVAVWVNDPIGAPSIVTAGEAVTTAPDAVIASAGRHAAS